MKPYQRIALDNPCRLAIETADPMYSHPMPGRLVRLTVNTGYE